MRRWMILAGLAAALLAVALLRPWERRPAASVPPPATASDGAPAAPGAAPHAAGSAGSQAVAAPSPQHPATGEAADAQDFHHGQVDGFTRSMLAYPITMRRLEAYVAAVKELRAAGEKDPALMARLRTPRPPGEQPAGTAARLEGNAQVKAILDRHGLTALDLMLMPPAVLTGRNAYALEQEHRPLAPGEFNADAVALWRADIQRMDTLSKAFLADLKILSGR